MTLKGADLPAEEVLRFWFGGIPPKGPVSQERTRFWFGGEDAVDREIRNRFGDCVEKAFQGEFESWRQDPRGTLALILLLDQFTRNIYRDSQRAFAGDDRALRISLEGLEGGQDRALLIVERAFFYLPLEHAEDLALQERSVALFTHLRNEASTEQKELCSGFLDYAVRHRDIIARFGRFPHRNRSLGRTSTAEEVEFLKQPGSSF